MFRDRGRVVMDDVVQVDRDYGFHKRQERMNGGGEQQEKCTIT